MAQDFVEIITDKSINNISLAEKELQKLLDTLNITVSTANKLNISGGKAGSGRQEGGGAEARKRGDGQRLRGRRGNRVGLAAASFQFQGLVPGSRAWEGGRTIANRAADRWEQKIVSQEIVVGIEVWQREHPPGRGGGRAIMVLHEHEDASRPYLCW